MRRRSWRRASIVITIVALASIWLVVALAGTGPSSESSGPKTFNLAATPAPPEVSAPTSAQLQAAASVFHVFNRASQAVDSPPSGSAYASGVSRRAGTSSGALQAWAVSTGNQVCVTVYTATGAASGPAACNTVVALNSSDQLLVDVSTTPATSSSEVIAGLAPDGVSNVTIDFQDGTSAVVPVVDNGFTYTTTDTKTISDFSWSRGGVANRES